ncbi:MAG: exodeoxyribonuclease VII large subunit [Actinobacteria bacterium]|nr:exodeoxyribonuclease VII large subunit [Actinomycetota bacterium]
MTLFDDPTPAVRKLSLVRLGAEVARSVAAVGKVAVEGEVHRPTTRPGGRVYFTLKDRAAQIDVTVPAARSRRARTVEGERVQATGILEWITGWGRLQFVAEEVVPVGAGAVAAMVAEARLRLGRDGLLDRPRRPIPRLPAAIGVVCGSEAAVRGDILSVVASRFPGYPIVFREVPVSGPGAADAIAGAVRDLDLRPEVEVILLARGGGDATQLLPFSDEELCRAICASRTPVVAAIGHEGDRPLCDEVVDLRCATPSLAAAAVVPDRAVIEGELRALRLRAESLGCSAVAVARRRLDAVDRDRAVAAGVRRATDRLVHARHRLDAVHPRHRVSRAWATLDGAHREMEALSPVRVLERGYAVVRSDEGSVLRDAGQVGTGDHVHVQLAAGRLRALVEEAAR